MIYTLTRSKRKTLAIYIRNGNIEVRAPLRMSKREIEKFITSKEKWILNNINNFRKQETQRGNFKLNYGDTVICKDKPCRITAIDEEVIRYDDGHFYMPSDMIQEQIKHACVEIYKMIARYEFTVRTHEFAQQMSIEPAAVRVNSAKSRWGSCSAKKSINFSWRLIMADEGVIDYVIVHELAHIIELNHSDRFWAIVENVLPDYKARKKRLKQLQNRLSGEEWD